MRKEKMDFMKFYEILVNVPSHLNESIEDI